MAYFIDPIDPNLAFWVDWCIKTFTEAYDCIFKKGKVEDIRALQGDFF
jgi:hypothetical protein